MEQSTVLVKMIVNYDADKMTERDAQEHLLDILPGEIHYVEIVAGLVDNDGVPIQPKAT